MAILTTDFGLVVHVFIGIPIAHDIPRGMAVDTVQAAGKMDVRADMGNIAAAADHLRTRPAVPGRDHGVVAVIQPLIGKGDAAAAVVAAEADIIARQGRQRMIGGMGPFAFDGGIAAGIGSGIIVWKMAGRTPGAVAGRVFLIGFPAKMALGAEFAKQFAGKIFQLGHAVKLLGLAVCRKNVGAMRAVKPAVCSFPGLLNVSDHTAVGVHEIGLHPL